MNTVNLDRYDRHSFQEIKSESSGIQQLEEMGKQSFASFPYLMEDTYGALYKNSPEVKQVVSPAYEVNKKIMEQLLQTREYKELREFTRLQNFESAVGVRAFSDYLQSHLPKEIKDDANRLTTAQEYLNKLLDMATDDTITNEDVKSKIKNLRNEMEKLSINLIDKMGKSSDEFRSIIRKAANKASEETQEVQTFMNSFGSEPGQSCKLPMRQKINLARRLIDNPKLRKISQIAGRFQRLALFHQQTKTKHGFDEVMDVETGDNLSRVVPSELLLVDDPDLNVIFLQKLAEKKLLQFRLQGKESETKGPIVVCIDGSGSMAGVPEIWAKGLALGLLTIARKQKRSFAIVHFGSASEIAYFSFPNATAVNQDALIAALSHFYGGGTDFATPLKTAIGIIRGQKNFRKADIVFITDGYCSMTSDQIEDVTKAKKELEFKILSLLVGNVSDLPFKSDAVCKISNFNEDAPVLETIYGSI